VQILDLCHIQNLAAHHPDRAAGAPIVANEERRAGEGAEIDLARHHLLHCQIAGGDGEFFHLDAVLLQVAGMHQIPRRHAPHVAAILLAVSRTAIHAGYTPSRTLTKRATVRYAR
jgi:hypothetical protein